MQEQIIAENPVKESSDQLSWYVLNYVGPDATRQAQKIVDRFNAANDLSLELFAPTYMVKEEKDGKINFRTVKLTFHYVFLRGSFTDVKQLCLQPNGFSFMIDRGSEERYATVSDRQMAGFKNIANAYKNCLPYFPLDEIDLEEGDLVEVVRGDFPGLVGTFMPNAKSKTGNIVLNIYNKVGTIAFNVKATDVRVLEFSAKSTRANDQIDAFVPVLLKALRYFHADEPLPQPLAAKLAVFCGRMEVVKITNRKLNARLQALLYAANTILGNPAAAAQAKQLFDRLKQSVTNVWTLALIRLLLAILTRTTPVISSSLSSSSLEISSESNYLFKPDASASATALPEPSSKLQRLIADEYAYYAAQ